MISHRLRALAAGIPVIALSAVLVASPGFASGSLEITSTLAGTTVSGELVVEGAAMSADTGMVAVALAPQTLVDCGAPLVESRVAPVDERFAASIRTTAVPDGVYCVIAMAGDGRLSTAVGDVTVNNADAGAESVEGLELPTLSVDDPMPTAVEPPAPARADLSSLGAIVLGLTAALASVVLALGLWAQRRSSRASATAAVPLSAGPTYP